MRLFASLFIVVSLGLSCLSHSAFSADQGVPVLVASPAPSSQTVAVAEPAAPPAWAQDLMVNAEKLPVVGPFVTKALLYAGIVSSSLTAFLTFLMGLLSSLSSIANFAGLAALSQKIQDFKNGKIVYWLKYFSMFNAKKPGTA